MKGYLKNVWNGVWCWIIYLDVVDGGTQDAVVAATNAKLDAVATLNQLRDELYDVITKTLSVFFMFLLV